MQSFMLNVSQYQVQSLFTNVDAVDQRGRKHLNSKAHIDHHCCFNARHLFRVVATCLWWTGDIFPFIVFQVARGRARRDVRIPSIRSGNSRENSSSAFTSTKRSVYNSRGCSIYQIARSKSGFRTGGWKRRNWTETVYSTTPQTPCYKNWTKAAAHPLI